MAFRFWKASSERAVRSARDNEAPGTFVVVVVVVVVWGLHVSASEDSESERAIPRRPVSRVYSAMVVLFGGNICCEDSWGLEVWWFFGEVLVWCWVV